MYPEHCEYNEEVFCLNLTSWNILFNPTPSSPIFFSMHVNHIAFYNIFVEKLFFVAVKSKSYFKSETILALKKVKLPLRKHRKAERKASLASYKSWKIRGRWKQEKFHWRVIGFYRKSFFVTRNSQIKRGWSFFSEAFANDACSLKAH